jgi:hypothetical protein
MRAAQALEIQRLMTSGVKRNKAIEQVNNTPMEDLGILQDISALSSTLKFSRSSSKAFSRQTSKLASGSGSSKAFESKLEPPLAPVEEAFAEHTTLGATKPKSPSKSKTTAASSTKSKTPKSKPKGTHMDDDVENV